MKLEPRQLGTCRLDSRVNVQTTLQFGPVALAFLRLGVQVYVLFTFKEITKWLGFTKNGRKKT